MWTIQILGDLRVSVDGRPMEVTAGVRAETLVLIAVSGRDGISAGDLGDALANTGRSREPGTLQRRLSDLRRLGLPIPDIREAGRYRLEERAATVDAWDFVDGVGKLDDGVQDAARLDDLLGLWRGNPLAKLGERVRRWWKPVIDARQRLTEVLEGLDPVQRGRLTQLRRYADLFPEDRALQRLSGAPSGKPRLLVVEDQVMDEIVHLLGDEFEIVPAVSYEQWCDIRDGPVLSSIQAALVDRHLDVSRLDDSLGTTKVATYLQMNTDIPVTLMSVDVDCSANKQFQLCLKYRLMDVIRKHEDGSLNRDGLVEAARAMTDQSPKGRRARMARWVESVTYRVQDENLFGPGTDQRVLQCLGDRNRVLKLLERGDLDQAETEMARFMATWGRAAAAARP